MRNAVLVALAITALNTLIYAQVRSFDFVNYDDNLHVYDNPSAQRGLSLESVRWAFSSTLLGNYIPITALTFLVDYGAYGLNPGGYHVTSLFFHCVNSILLLIVLYRFTGRLWPSAMVAVLFAVHPLHVESVAWISARKDVVSTFFWFLAMLAYGRYARAPRVIPYLLCLAAFTVGLLAKPMLVTLPCVFLLLDYWPLRRFKLDGSASFAAARRLVIEKVPFFLVTAFVVAATVVAQRWADSLPPSSFIAHSDRVANALVSYGSYVFKLFVPLRLIPFYPHPGSSIPLWQIAGAVVFLVTVTTLSIRLRQRRPYIIVGWLWFVGTLVPVIGIVQVGGQAMADRYSYVPYVGLFIAIAWTLADAVESRRSCRGPVVVIVFIATALFAGLSWKQTSVWKNSITLFEHTLIVSPTNRTALSNLGSAYLEAGRIDDAVRTIEKSVSFSPNSTGNRRNLGLAYRKSGRYEDAETQFREALRIDPDAPRSHNHFALVLMDQGKLVDARAHLNTALELDPENPEAHQNLGNLLLREGNAVDAIRHYRAVLEKKPADPDALINIGAALLMLEDYPRAEKTLRESLALNPNDAVALVNLAVALDYQGEAAEARRYAERALEVEPGYTKAAEFLRFLEEETRSAPR